MTAGRLDDVVRPEVTRYLPRLGGRLDDNEPADVVAVSASAVVVSQQRLRSNSVVPTATGM